MNEDYIFPRLKKINKTNLLFSDDPYLSMAQVASTFYPDCEYPNFSYPDSKKKKTFSDDQFIHKDSEIGDNCMITNEKLVRFMANALGKKAKLFYLNPNFLFLTGFGLSST